MCFDFPYDFCVKSSNSKKNSVRYYYKYIYIYMYVGLGMKYLLCFSDFNGTWIFSKNIYMKFHENPSSGSQVLCGRADRHDETNSRFS